MGIRNTTGVMVQLGMPFIKMKINKYLIMIFIISVVAHLVFADDNIFCVNDEIKFTCAIGATQNNITIINESGLPILNLTASQNYLGMWNASYTFANPGYFCARCNRDNVSKCFFVEPHCQKNIQTNLTNIKTAIDDIQTDIGDPSGSGTTLFALLNSIYNWVQTNIVNRIGVNVH